ncbi:hypothetical protein ShirakiTB12_54490 [Priestia megaterium]|uniref:Uncharacterized protein n=1 Tax=Priestia megaterium TaxID=1404 RepID=A0AAX6BTF3_PRIMG|nr:hypothetical protein [Priestia megaterium]GMG76980.1 hypothetical protein ShirakiTB12_54490 [Priestia megaterium]
MLMIFLIAALVSVSGWMVKRRIISIAAALIAVVIFVYNPEIIKQLGEIGPQIAGPIVGVK